MKQKWPILIFSALLTAFIVLAGIWGNAQFEHLHSGSVLTAPHAVQGIALDGWRQEAPGQWHFTFTVGEDIPSLTLCVTNTAVPLAPESLTSLEHSGELYALDVTPGETVELWHLWVGDDREEKIPRFRGRLADLDREALEQLCAPPPQNGCPGQCRMAVTI